jgi:hypothetical protein
MKRFRLSATKIMRFSAVTVLVASCCALISSVASKADSASKSSAYQVEFEQNQYHQNLGLSERQPDESYRFSNQIAHKSETLKVNQTEEVQYSDDDFSPANSTCSYGISEVTCCNKELRMCLVSEWHPVEASSAIPESAKVSLTPIMASPKWDGMSTIFERDFGFCARSAKHEYCYETASEEITVFDWMRDDTGDVVLMNRTLFDPSSSID